MSPPCRGAQLQAGGPHRAEERTPWVSAGCFSKAGSRGCAPESASHFYKKMTDSSQQLPQALCRLTKDCLGRHTCPAVGRAWFCLAQCLAALGRARPWGQARMPALGPRELGPSVVGSGPRVWGLCPHTPEPVVRVSHIASRWLRSLHPKPPRAPTRPSSAGRLPGPSCSSPWPALTLSSVQPVCPGKQPARSRFPDSTPGGSPGITLLPQPSSAALPHPILPPRPLAHLPQAAWPLGSLSRTADPPGPLPNTPAPTPPVHCQAHPPWQGQAGLKKPGQVASHPFSGHTKDMTLSPWQPPPQSPLPQLPGRPASLGAPSEGAHSPWVWHSPDSWGDGDKAPRAGQPQRQPCCPEILEVGVTEPRVCGAGPSGRCWLSSAGDPLSSLHRVSPWGLCSRFPLQ